jgi:hypothetical protein
MLLRPLFLVCLISVSHLSLSQESTARPRVPGTCPVTKPSDRPLVAPSPYPAHAPAGSFWFGTDRLWTILPNGATWPRRQKTFWWRQNWLGYKSDIPKGEASKLIVTARRLDLSAPPAKTSGSLGGYREDWKSFLVGGIDFPTFGCWEVSAHYEHDELTFVVWVPGDTVVVSKAGIIYVVGDVHRPTTVAMENTGHITVLQALATAEGVNQTARLHNAKIIRKGENGPTEIPVDIKKIVQAKAPDVTLQAGDILFIPGGAAKSAGKPQDGSPFYDVPPSAPLQGPTPTLIR